MSYQKKQDRLRCGALPRIFGRPGVIAVVLLFILCPLGPLLAQGVTVKLRDVANISGYRMNQLVGYGLVIGLPGTGDSKTELSTTAIKNLLSNLGQNVPDGEFKSRNIASVIITAQLPPFHQSGDRIDVMVSSIGDARSLRGGFLVQSPLKGADGKVYAVAQGRLSQGAAGPSSRRLSSKGGDTIGYVFGGGLVERIVPAAIESEGKLEVVLKEFDFSLARNLEAALRGRYGQAAVNMADSGRIRVAVPQAKSLVAFIGELQELEVQKEMPARVVINEKTGTIVMGGHITVSEVAVSQKGLELKVARQSNPPVVLYGGNRPKPNPEGLLMMKPSATVADVVSALNAVGASTQDIIHILQTLKVAGALNAEVEVL